MLPGNACALVWPSRLSTAALSKSTSRPAAAARPSISAVPEGIDLLVVVHLDDFDVVALWQRPRRLAHETFEDIHPEREIAGLDDARAGRGRL